jgi:hypothetical protein
MANPPNLYASDCFECGGHVPARGGTREFWQGAWRIRHHACDERAAVIDAAIEGAESRAALHRSRLRHPSNAARPEPTSGQRAASVVSAGICPRHGEMLGDKGCWECNMEADEAERDREETRRVAKFKMRRDGFQ